MSTDDAVTWLFYYLSLFFVLGMGVFVETSKDKEEKKKEEERKKEKTN